MHDIGFTELGRNGRYIFEKMIRLEGRETNALCDAYEDGVVACDVILNAMKDFELSNSGWSEKHIAALDSTKDDYSGLPVVEVLDMLSSGGNIPPAWAIWLAKRSLESMIEQPDTEYSKKMEYSDYVKLEHRRQLWRSLHSMMPLRPRHRLAVTPRPHPRSRPGPSFCTF